MLTTNDTRCITQPYFNDPTNRWLKGLSNDDHHSMKALSSSAIKYFHKNSPWAFHQKYVLKNIKSKEVREEFKIGTLIHLAVLEPEKFEKTVLMCDLDNRTKEFKEFRDSTLKSFKKTTLDEALKTLEGQVNSMTATAESLGEPAGVYGEAAEMTQKVIEAKKKRSSKSKVENLVVREEILVKEEFEITTSKQGGYLVDGEEIFFVKSSEMDMYRKIQDNIKKHPKVNSLLQNCSYIEQSGIAQCPRTGLYLSLRGDARSDDGYFVDPKSINSLSMHSMESTQAAYSYYLQHVHYIYTANLIEHNKYDRFYFIYISKEAPYEVCFTHLEDSDIRKAEEVYLTILTRIAECEYKNDWPTLDSGKGLMLKIPRWAF